MEQVRSWFALNSGTTSVILLLLSSCLQLNFTAYLYITCLTRRQWWWSVLDTLDNFSSHIIRVSYLVDIRYKRKRRDAAWSSVQTAGLRISSSPCLYSWTLEERARTSGPTSVWSRRNSVYPIDWVLSVTGHQHQTQTQHTRPRGRGEGTSFGQPHNLNLRSFLLQARHPLLVHRWPRRLLRLSTSLFSIWGYC